MIINATYFIGDIYLPQVGANASTVVNDNALLDSFIQQYEPELLNKALGRNLYNEFKSQLNTEGTDLEIGVDQKWGNLLNGTSYIKDGITYYWRGLVDSSKSLIAYYIYSHLIESKVRQQTTLGTVKSESKNTISVNATPEIVRAWRKFHEWYQGDIANSPTVYQYRGVFVEDYFNGDNNSKDVSLHTFLSDNESDYSDWYFTPIENKNNWGL